MSVRFVWRTTCFGRIWPSGSLYDYMQTSVTFVFFSFLSKIKWNIFSKYMLINLKLTDCKRITTRLHESFVVMFYIPVVCFLPCYYCRMMWGVVVLEHNTESSGSKKVIIYTRKCTIRPISIVVNFFLLLILESSAENIVKNMGLHF
jgi:hypothetical protein